LWLILEEIEKTYIEIKLTSSPPRFVVVDLEAMGAHIISPLKMLFPGLVPVALMLMLMGIRMLVLHHLLLSALENLGCTFFISHEISEMLFCALQINKN